MVSTQSSVATLYTSNSNARLCTKCFRQLFFSNIQFFNKLPLFYSPSTNAINPQNAASNIFRNAPISAPLSIVDGVDDGMEVEVADAESPVSDGPDDADAAV